MTITFFMLLLSLTCPAPDNNALIIPVEGEIRPFETLLQAVVCVESNGDNHALNQKEMAYGAFQIRAIRLRDYEMRTGIRYTLEDCFNPAVSRKIFLYYANQIKDLETIAKRWNGSGPMTDVYWSKVKKLL